MVKVMKNFGWPELVVQSGGQGLSALGVAIFIYARGLGLPPKGQRRWVAACGLFMAASVVCSIMAMDVGAPLGDVSALVSINVVMAALLGRVLLGETLRGVHAVSVLCSVVGAVLIARPEAIFGRRETVDSPLGNAWVGYVLAPIGGFFDACTLICARKCQGASEWHIAFAYYFQGFVFLAALIATPGIQPEPFAKPMAAPMEAVGWLAAMASIDMPSMVLYSRGAMALPAALSATVDTAGRMVLGFVVDWLLFGKVLGAFTATGAALMLLGVVAMALVRERPNDRPEDAERGAAGPEVSQVSAEHVEEQDDVSSVASFAATEFVDLEPRARNLRPIVQRLRWRWSRRASASPADAPAGSIVGAVTCASG